MNTIDMTRHQGGKDVALVELTDRRRQTYIVRTDLQPYQTEDADGVTFIETHFDYKPSMDEIKAFIFAVINDQVKTRILSGFVWSGLPIWLSEENQMNWSQAVVPDTFKIGEEADGTPVYHEFATEDEMKAFNEAWRAYIQRCLQDGWKQKDGYDFSEYERQLNAL